MVPKQFVPPPHFLLFSPSAFNNILSNLGYILLGLLFLLIILQREINYNRALMRNDLQAVVGNGVSALNVLLSCGSLASLGFVGRCELKE